jgi:glycine/D-amino acid oxidase-like deaminating enzyme
LEPAIGMVDGTGICLAYGHYRSGILLAPVTAEIVADSLPAL